ncbi:MAG: hypothetical protein ACI36Y_05050 [Coriobacteriales bacterium]
MGAQKGKKRKRTRNPVDLGKLRAAAEEYTASLEAPLNISLVIDATAGDGLINCLLGALRTQEPSIDLRCTVLAGELPQLGWQCDLCVVVAGQSLLLGEVVAQGQAQGVPVVVALEEGETYFAQSPEQAAEILGLEGDDPAAAAPAGIPLDCIVAVDPGGEEPLAELGAWIACNAPQARLALARSYAFCRRPVALELTRRAALLNAGVGALVMVPGADMPVITMNQAKLVLQVAGLYGQPLDTGRMREVLAVVAGAFGLRAVARELADAVPGLGWGVKGAVAYSGTVAMGRAAIDCFEEGGTLNSLGAALERAAGELSHQGE